MSSHRTRNIVVIVVIVVVIALLAAYSYFVVLAAPSSSTSQISTTTASSSSSSPTLTTSSSGTSYTSSWLTYHLDLTRSGYDPNEPSIETSLPTLAWKSPTLDGQVYAEPLIYDGHVFIATENNSVYALSEGSGSVVWQKNLGPPVPSSTLPCGDIDPSGITSTPVIDTAKNEIFVVAYIYLQNQQAHELFALNLVSGNVMFERNVNPPNVSPQDEQQRGALAIANGFVYIPYGGLYGDCGQYHGFVLGVPENNTGSTLSYQDPTGREGGIWGPSGMAIDSSGNVFVSTGNSEATQNFDFGDAVIKLSPTLNEIAYFAPTNWATLNSNDIDLSSVGPSILGNTGTIFQIGKEGVGYLLNMNDLGQIGGQEFEAMVCPSGAGAYGGNAYVGPIIYVPCQSGLVALKVDFGTNPSFSSLWNGTQFNAGAPIVAGNAVWTVDIGSATLYAMNPDNGTVIFSYHLHGADHFISPASAGGLVFVGGGNVAYAFNI
jgi:outer membrane protein assembly factor BamB